MRLPRFSAYFACLLVALGALPNAPAGELDLFNFKWSLPERRTREFSFRSGPSGLSRSGFAPTYLPTSYTVAPTASPCVPGTYSVPSSYATGCPPGIAFNAPPAPVLPAIAAGYTAVPSVSYGPSAVVPSAAPPPGPVLTVVDQATGLPLSPFQETQQVLQRLQPVFAGGAALQAGPSAAEISQQLLALTRAVERIAAQVSKHEEALNALKADKPKPP
jgi:hypothetical protein